MKGNFSAQASDNNLFGKLEADKVIETLKHLVVQQVNIFQILIELKGTN